MKLVKRKKRMSWFNKSSNLFNSSFSVPFITSPPDTEFYQGDSYVSSDNNGNYRFDRKPENYERSKPSIHEIVYGSKK